MSNKPVAIAAAAVLAAGVYWIFKVSDRKEIDFLARTMWGEARGEGATGMAAVGHVIMNRVADRRWPSTVEGVVTQRFQFSAWNEADPNRAKLLAVTDADAAFRVAQAFATAIYFRDPALPDTTGGATHYHSNSLPAVLVPWTRPPAQISANIGNHLFYTGVA